MVDAGRGLVVVSLTLRAVGLEQPKLTPVESAVILVEEDIGRRICGFS